MLRKKNTFSKDLRGSLSSASAVVAFEFSVPHSDRVAITIYDMAGREMSNLVNKQYDAGSYRYNWDTRTFARGCYMVKLQAGGNKVMKLVQVVC